MMTNPERAAYFGRLASDAIALNRLEQLWQEALAAMREEQK